MPQESTGFLPFELLYGWRVKGPLDVLREAWTGECGGEIPVLTHVIEMRERLQETAENARENLRKAQGKQKAYYDGRAREWNLEVGEEVLVLLPTLRNRMRLGWVGPYRIARNQPSGL